MHSAKEAVKFAVSNSSACNIAATRSRCKLTVHARNPLFPSSPTVSEVFLIGNAADVISRLLDDTSVEKVVFSRR